MRPLPTAPEILYRPPKSASFGHASIPRDPARGWLHTLTFLDTVSVCSINPRLELRISHYPEWTDEKLIERCIAEATEQFGEPSRIDGTLNKQWDVSSAEVGKAVAFALLDKSRPIQQVGPTWLSFTYDLCWKPHPTLPQTERPGDGSYLGVIHGGRRLFLQPTFRFPFEAPTPNFKAFVTHVQTHLPFTFKEANFKLVLPSTTGKAPHIRKIPSGWLDA